MGPARHWHSHSHVGLLPSGEMLSISLGHLGATGVSPQPDWQQDYPLSVCSPQLLRTPSPGHTLGHGGLHPRAVVFSVARLWCSLAPAHASWQVLARLVRWGPWRLRVRISCSLHAHPEQCQSSVALTLLCPSLVSPLLCLSPGLVRQQFHSSLLSPLP